VDYEIDAAMLGMTGISIVEHRALPPIYHQEFLRRKAIIASSVEALQNQRNSCIAKRVLLVEGTYPTFSLTLLTLP
jgi:hypothetical protein